MFNLFGPKVPQITPDEVKKSLDTKEKIILLDVRTTSEYSKGKIESSINLPLDQVSQKITNVIPDKDKKIYVYCLSGARSISAVDSMTKLGYKNVFNMSNGLLAWRAKSYPVSP